MLFLFLALKNGSKSAWFSKIPKKLLYHSTLVYLVLLSSARFERQDIAAGAAVKEGSIVGVGLRSLQLVHEHALHHSRRIVGANVHNNLENVKNDNLYYFLRICDYYR